MPSDRRAKAARDQPAHDDSEYGNQTTPHVFKTLRCGHPVPRAIVSVSHAGHNMSRKEIAGGGVKTAPVLLLSPPSQSGGAIRSAVVAGYHRGMCCAQQGTDIPSVETIRYMLAMWTSIALWQIGRLEEAVDDYTTAEAEGSFRTAFEEVGQPSEWRETYAAYTATITQAQVWQVGAERYFLLNSLAQVRKCAVNLPDDGLPTVRDMNVLRLLRDIDEHWEQLDGRSLKEIRESRPEVAPGQMWRNNKHIWIGDVDTEELAGWLSDVDRVVRERSATDGSHIPRADTVIRFAARAAGPSAT
jgi:hypothetical protein